MPSLYETRSWRDLRSRVLADAECALANLAGECQGDLQLHHIEPVAEGGPEIPSSDGVTWLCSRHHAAVHLWRRKQEERKWKRCHHVHRYDYARRQCEAKLNR